MSESGVATKKKTGLERSVFYVIRRGLLVFLEAEMLYVDGFHLRDTALD